jgi:hypothetical protein
MLVAIHSMFDVGRSMFNVHKKSIRHFRLRRVGIKSTMSGNTQYKMSYAINRFKESQAYFVIFKLPTLLITAILGFIIEFIMELPFMAVCLIDSWFKKRKLETQPQISNIEQETVE